MRIPLLALCIALSASSMIAKYDPDRPEAQPNKELSKLKSFLRSAYDFMGLEYLGYQAVKEENEAFIRSIIIELGMEDYCIEIRGMSNIAKFIFGRTNAFVIPPIFWTRTSHAYLYISEDWFDTLPDSQKYALIKHELMHIKHHHGFKKFAVGFSAGMLFNAINNTFQQSIAKSYNYKVPRKSAANIYLTSGDYIPTMLQLLTICYYSRILEKEADIEAAKTTPDKQGFVDLFKEIESEVHDPSSKFVIKRFIGKLLGAVFNSKLFASHPDFDERIAYIQALE